MSIAEKVSEWIEKQEFEGYTRDEIAKKVLICGDSVIHLKKSGKNKYDIKVTFGCPVLNDH